MLSVMAAWGKRVLGSKSTDKKNIQYWALLGPYFIIISLGAIFLRSSFSDFSLFLISSLGVFGSFKWGVKGLIVSSALLAFFYPLFHTGLWTLAFSVSLFFSFFLSALSSKENDAIEKAIETSLEKQQQELAQLQTLVKEAETRGVYKEEKIAALEKELQVAHEKMKELKEVKPLKPVQLSFLEEEEVPVNRLHQEVLQMEYLNKQMRRQFEEKSEVLHQTRVQLFQTETALFVLQKKFDERFLETNPQESHLIDQLNTVEQEREILEGEVEKLEEIIATLITKKV
jgi:hypothetical protein